MYIFGQKNYKVDIFAFRKNVITGLITIMNSVISPDFFSMQLANIVQDKFLCFCVFTWTIDVIAGVSVSGILGLPGLGLMPEGIGIFTVPRYDNLSTFNCKKMLINSGTWLLTRVTQSENRYELMFLWSKISFCYINIIYRFTFSVGKNGF